MITGIIALVVGFALGFLVLGLRNRNIKVAWYEWVIGATGLLLVVFSVWAYFPSMGEVETKAANMFLLVTGLPGLVLVGLASALVVRHKRVTT